MAPRLLGLRTLNDRLGLLIAETDWFVPSGLSFLAIRLQFTVRLNAIGWPKGLMTTLIQLLIP